jgi:hypothetical protein
VGADGKSKGKGKKGTKVEAHPGVVAAVAPVLDKLQEIKEHIDTSEAGSEGAYVQGLKEEMAKMWGTISQLAQKLEVLMNHSSSSGDIGGDGDVEPAQPQASQWRKAPAPKCGGSKKKKTQGDVEEEQDDKVALPQRKAAAPKRGASKKKKTEEDEEEEEDNKMHFVQGHSGAPPPVSVLPQAAYVATAPHSYALAQFYPQVPVALQVQVALVPYGQYPGAESAPKRQSKRQTASLPQWSAVMQHVPGCVCEQCRRHSS